MRDFAIDSKESNDSDGRITAQSKARKHFIHRAKPRKTKFELLNVLTQIQFTPKQN